MGSSGHRSRVRVSWCWWALGALLWPAAAQADEPTGDEWSTAINKGMKQEGIQSQNEREAAAARQARLERLRWRVGAGVQTALTELRYQFSTTSPPFASGDSNATPTTVALGGGLQVGLSRRWAFVGDARLVVGRQTSADGYYNNFEPVDGSRETSSTVLGFQLDPEFRVHPGGLEAAFFTSFGLALEYWRMTFSKEMVQRSYASSTPATPFTVDESIAIVAGGPQLGLGVQLGDDNRYELALKVALPVSSGKEPYIRGGLHFNLMF